MQTLNIMITEPKFHYPGKPGKKRTICGIDGNITTKKENVTCKRCKGRLC